MTHIRYIIISSIILNFSHKIFDMAGNTYMTWYLPFERRYQFVNILHIFLSLIFEAQKTLIEYERCYFYWSQMCCDFTLAWWDLVMTISFLVFSIFFFIYFFFSKRISFLVWAFYLSTMGQMQAWVS